MCVSSVARGRSGTLFLSVMRFTMRCRGLVSVALIVAALAGKPEVEEDAVTYGSVLKMQHAESKYWLHSHTINWGSGSGQQSVTAHGGGDDQGSLWVIKEGQANAAAEAGEPVMCGSTVRLGHLQTERNLHSHLFHSPLSGQQEVSCFGEGGRGDTGDDWEVQCTGQAWQRGKDVRLKHKDTGKFLHSQAQNKFTQRNCPNCPIIGQQEVTAMGGANAQNVWRADQGVFFHPRKDETCDQ